MMSGEFLPQLASTRIGTWTVKRLVSPLQRWIYRTTRGKLFSRIGSARNVLLLTTKGHRTSLMRTIPLFYLPENESLVICNVSIDHENINPWVINLRYHPLAQVQIGANTSTYRAREANEIETRRFWPRLVELWPAYLSHYEHSGQRAIFILEPVP